MAIKGRLQFTDGRGVIYLERKNVYNLIQLASDFMTRTPRHDNSFLPRLRELKPNHCVKQNAPNLGDQVSLEKAIKVKMGHFND